jgi:cell division transport system ATP-binding protein
MIVLRSVTKIYENGTRALDDVTLAVPRRDFVFLVGPNGAGKSTLLRLLIRAERPTSGCILVEGQDLALLDERDLPAFRRRIGVVFQDMKLFPQKTVYENVAFPLEVAHVGGREMRRAVMATLELVGLAAEARRTLGQLSGGQRQRVAIARAIVHEPDVLIADEPTANLPPDTAWEIVQLLATINRSGVTALIATHDRDVVDTMERRVVALHDGRIVRDERAGRYEGV